jgi:hypothetical protein
MQTPPEEQGNNCPDNDNGKKRKNRSAVGLNGPGSGSSIRAALRCHICNRSFPVLNKSGGGHGCCNRCNKTYCRRCIEEVRNQVTGEVFGTFVRYEKKLTDGKTKKKVHCEIQSAIPNSYPVPSNEGWLTFPPAGTKKEQADYKPETIHDLLINKDWACCHCKTDTDNQPMCDSITITMSNGPKILPCLANKIHNLERKIKIQHERLGIDIPSTDDSASAGPSRIGGSSSGATGVGGLTNLAIGIPSTPARAKRSSSQTADSLNAADGAGAAGLPLPMPQLVPSTLPVGLPTNDGEHIAGNGTSAINLEQDRGECSKEWQTNSDVLHNSSANIAPIDEFTVSDEIGMTTAGFIDLESLDEDEEQKSNTSNASSVDYSFVDALITDGKTSPPS